MVERGYGRIVNVASIAGKEGNPMAAAYSAAKAAVIAMTKAIGKDVARTGVLVNCIAPAVIETPILDGLDQEHVDYMVERIPMGRMGTRTRSRRSPAGSRARSARSRPARRTTSPGAGRSTDAPHRPLGGRRRESLGRSPRWTTRATSESSPACEDPMPFLAGRCSPRGTPRDRRPTRTASSSATV
jgi:hypothetical protein